MLELATNSPGTLDALARTIAAGRHRHCLSSVLPCDRCNAIESIVNLLKAVGGK